MLNSPIKLKLTPRFRLCLNEVFSWLRDQFNVLVKDLVVDRTTIGLMWEEDSFSVVG
jgi:hypothetical protein